MGARLLALGLAAYALTGASGCGGDGHEAPDRLVDGRHVLVVPVELEGVDEPAVLTADVVRRSLVGERTLACLAQWERRSVRASVERVGVLAESVTLAEAAGRALLACDDSAGPREGDRRWCGTAFGLLHAGRLRDPRLDVLCTTEDGAALGIAWLKPSPDAAYVAVAHDGWVEVYETAGGLPVRVATTDVDPDGTAATFDVSEHTNAGRLLRTYRIDAAVAG